MDKKQIDSLVTVTILAGRLKSTLRTGWILKGVKNPESVADHTWRMCLLCILLAPKDVNKEKLLEMCVVHDLGEIESGDVRWESGRKVISSQLAKHNTEMDTLNKIFQNYPNGKKYINLVNEYNNQQTKEAKFLKLIDKLEMVIQALEYERESRNVKDLNEFWENVEKYLTGTELEPIFRELQKMRKS